MAGAEPSWARAQVVEGMKFDRGYISPYFVTDPKTMKAELDDPFILIAEKKISSCGARPRPLLLIACAGGLSCECLACDFLHALIARPNLSG